MDATRVSGVVIKMINEEYIVKIISECKLSDFTADDKNIVRTDGLPDYVDKIIEDTLGYLVSNSEQLVKDKFIFEIQNSMINIETQKLALFFRVSESIYNYLIRFYYKENITINVFSHFVISAINQYQTILSENLSGGFISVIAQVRILYENFVSYMYIRKYPSLAIPFRDHAEIIKFKLFKELKSNNTDEENKEYNILLEKHGEDFIDDYGWTKSIIKNRKERILITMVKDIELIDYKALYKISSNFIHPSSFSIFFNESNQKTFLTAFIATSVEIVTNHIIHFMKDISCKEKDRILLMNLLYGLREELYNEPRTIE
jgi:hypothetical protein